MMYFFGLVAVFYVLFTVLFGNGNTTIVSTRKTDRELDMETRRELAKIDAGY